MDISTYRGAVRSEKGSFGKWSPFGFIGTMKKLHCCGLDEEKPFRSKKRDGHCVL